MTWQNKKVLVAGLGETGFSLLRFFVANHAQVFGFDEHLSDDRKSLLAAEFPDVICFEGNLKDVLSAEYAVLAVSPGIPTHDDAIRAFQANGGRVWGDVEIFAQLVAKTDSQVIAITGSNGKTTVTSLVGHLCRKMGLKTEVAGNIGLPVLSAWQKHEQQELPDVWVLELSSFQLDTTESLNADVATVLNISEDHLDRYDDLLDYAHSKDRIFKGTGVQVLNHDDVFCRAMKRPEREVKWFSLQHETDFWMDAATQTLLAKQENLCALSRLPIQGTHNAANVMVAIAMCEAIGLERERLLEHVMSFEGLPHRVELIGQIQGIQFIDDSKGTNVGATCAAIAGLPEPIVLIAGGVGKGQDFSPLAKSLEGKARAVVLIGEDAPIITKQLSGLSIPVLQASSMDEAVKMAYENAQNNDIVLLSPACASWDMFNGYSHRAQVFIECYEKLAESAS